MLPKVIRFFAFFICIASVTGSLLMLFQWISYMQYQPAKAYPAKTEYNITEKFKDGMKVYYFSIDSRMKYPAGNEYAVSEHTLNLYESRMYLTEEGAEAAAKEKTAETMKTAYNVLYDPKSTTNIATPKDRNTALELSCVYALIGGLSFYAARRKWTRA